MRSSKEGNVLAIFFLTARLAERADVLAAVFELGHVGAVYYGYGQLLAYANLERWRRATRAARESHPRPLFQAYGADRCAVFLRLDGEE